MHRKIFKTGNSLVVSLPKELLEPLGMQDGTNVSVELDRENRQINIRPTRQMLKTNLSQEFSRQVDEFIEEYRTALEALAR